MKIPTSVIVEEINDKHMTPWAEICAENTPLTPFMDIELIQHYHLNLSNEKLKSTGYRLKVPILIQEHIEEVRFYLFASGSLLNKSRYCVISLFRSPMILLNKNYYQHHSYT